ncbi:hypothetical protein RND71_027476 [Anisodus tanguticus]|uniref:Uncharacterized protein n=1 Tax=Anisodus tanguticus TaxID=243964 RepID=A0AAE1RHW8_9SOLA|nr:hypothetical protein RND71_027476 [Anisodus tanguticus]
MSGRTIILILFFWAVLTIVTPVLVRLSASAKANGEFFVIKHTSKDIVKLFRHFLSMVLSSWKLLISLFAGDLKEKTNAGKVIGLLPRRALVAAAISTGVGAMAGLNTQTTSLKCLSVDDITFSQVFQSLNLSVTHGMQ